MLREGRGLVNRQWSGGDAIQMMRRKKRKIKEAENDKVTLSGAKNSNKGERKKKEKDT